MIIDHALFTQKAGTRLDRARPGTGTMIIRTDIGILARSLVHDVSAIIEKLCIGMLERVDRFPQGIICKIIRRRHAHFSCNDDIHDQHGANDKARPM